MLGDEVLEECLNRVAVPLTRIGPNNHAFRVYQDKRWPGSNAVCLPGSHVGVVENRVVNIVSVNRLKNRVGKFFVLKFWRMHPHDGENVRMSCLEFAQFSQYVVAVHTAQRPKIEEQKPPAKALNTE